MESIRNFFASVDLVELALTWGVRLLLALLIFQVSRWLARWVRNGVVKLLALRKLDAVLIDFLATVTHALVLVIGLVAAIDYLGIPATSLLAVLGAAGLAVGLALKDSLSNFAAGVMLVLFRPFTKGDYIEAGGHTGTVESLSLVTTTLVTLDNIQIAVPNSAIWGGSITNFSARDTRRVDLLFRIAFDDDLRAAAEALKSVLAAHPGVLKDPAPVVMVLNISDSSLELAVRPWVKTADFWTVRAEVIEQAKAALEAAGCSIPYPQRDVHQYVYHPVDAGDQ